MRVGEGGGLISTEAYKRVKTKKKGVSKHWLHSRTDQNTLRIYSVFSFQDMSEEAGSVF